MATYTDNFDRANGTVGNNWAIFSGTWNISSNQLQVTSSSVSQIAHGTGASATADQFGEITFANSVAGAVGIYLRLNNVATNWLLVSHSGSQLSFSYLQAGDSSSTLIGTAVSHTRAAGQVLRFEVEGTQLRAYINGALIHSVTSTNTVSGPGFGLRATSATGTLLDNAAWGDLTPGGDTTAPTVSITTPTAASTISGTTALTATATDNIAVTSVNFYGGGSTLLGSATNTSGSTWTLNYDTTAITNGAYSLTAVASDAASNTATSSAVSVTVDNSVSSGSLVSYWDGTTDVTVSETNATYWDGTTEQQFSGDLTLSYWDGVNETYLIPSTGPTLDPDPPTGPLTQATMPTVNQAWTLAAAPSLSMNAASQITGTLYLPTDARIKHTGFGSKGIVAAATSGYWRASYMADKGSAGTGTDPNYLAGYGTRFKTNANQVEIKMQQRPDLAGMSGVTTRMAIRIKVDGQWISRRPTYLGYTNIGYDTFDSPEFISPGEQFWVRLNFGSTTERVIEVVMMGEYGGVKVPTGATFTAAPDPAHTAVFLGDSLNGAERHGTGNFSLSSPEGSLSRGTYINISSIGNYAAHTLGYDNIVISAAGSSGFAIVGDTVAYSSATRMSQDVVAFDPELVIVGTSFNDIQAGRTTTQVNADADTVLANLKAALPDAIIVVLGNPTPPILGSEASGSAVVSPYNTALRQAANDADVWFIDPNLGDLFDPSGTVVYNSTNMITGNTAYISSDDQHPSQAGSDFFGLYLAEFLRRAHPAT